MPSHLDETKNEHKKLDAIQKLGIQEHDIRGNCKADELAKQGALLHATDKAGYHAASDRKKITCIVQQMQLHIWETYLQTAEEDVKCAEERDAIQSIEQALHEPDEDYDYDPFSEPFEHGGTFEDVNLDHNEHCDAPTDPILTPQQMHPNYGWGSIEFSEDKHFHIALPQ